MNTPGYADRAQAALASLGDSEPAEVARKSAVAAKSAAPVRKAAPAAAPATRKSDNDNPYAETKPSP